MAKSERSKYTWFIVDKKSTSLRSSNHADIGEPDGTIMFCKEIKSKAHQIRLETAGKASKEPSLVSPYVNGLIQLDTYEDAMWLFGIQSEQDRLKLYRNEQNWKNRHFLKDNANVIVRKPDVCGKGRVVSIQTKKTGRFITVDLEQVSHVVVIVYYCPCYFICVTMVFSLTLAIMSVTSDKITSGTIVMINTLQKLIYSRCRIMFILCFMPKRLTVTYVSECLAINNVLRMQGGHKPFSYVAISFSPKHYLM